MKKKFAIHCILLVSVLGVEKDWCKKGCAWEGKQHLRCIFKQLTSNELCPRIRSIITPDERMHILHYHNVLRSDVAGGNEPWRVGNRNFNGWNFSNRTAGDMRQMTWDYDLEKNARIYASQCNIKSHKPYDCAGTDGIPLVHMNKYDDTLSNTDMKDVFYDFVEKNFNSIKLYFEHSVIVRTYIPGPWDSFIAMIFSETYKLGCSKVLCGCNQGEPIYRAVTVTCLYGPSPNFSSDGYPVYDLAPTCSSCPNNTECKNSSAYPNLCAKPGDPLGPFVIPDLDGSRQQQHSPLVLVIALVAVAFVDYGC